MKSTVCKAHICWRCMELLNTVQSCHDHMIAEHGGMFDFMQPEYAHLDLVAVDFEDSETDEDDDWDDVAMQ